MKDLWEGKQLRKLHKIIVKKTPTLTVMLR